MVRYSVVYSAQMNTVRKAGLTRNTEKCPLSVLTGVCISIGNIEDITWPLRDTNFIFEC